MVLLLAVVFLLLLVAVIMLFVLVTRIKAQPGGETGLIFQQVENLRQEQARALDANSQLLNQRLAEIQRALLDTTAAVNTRLDNAAQLAGELNRRLGELSRAAEEVLNVGQEIASLQEILRAPKPRGVLGEIFLGNILQEMVPNHFELQYRFRSGATVDAVVRLGEKLVPIDAKFPLDDFQRMLAVTDEGERQVLRRQLLKKLKGYIDTIAEKYILPDEGTYDFALMYIPAENVYYETVVGITDKEESLLSYAFSRRVIPVSPGTIYAYLQAIVLGLRGLEVDRRANEILESLDRLEGDLQRFKEKFEVVGNHLNNAHNRYEDAARALERLTERLTMRHVRE